LPRSTTFGVAGDEADAGFIARLPHRGDDAFEVGQRQAFFENKRGGEKQRRGAAHGQIIDRSMHGEFADVAAGEEERADDKRIGGEGDAAGPSRRWPAVERTVAWSSRAARMSLRKSRQEDRAESGRRLSPPPLPWPRRMRS
jgi:hypothetical protein